MIESINFVNLNEPHLGLCDARSCAGDMEIYSSIISEAVGGIIGGIRMMNFYFLFQSGG